MSAPFNFIDLIGKHFGRLVCVKYAGQDAKREQQWLCVCECGQQKLVKTRLLRNGDVRSCGCLLIDRASRMNLKHGMVHSAEYRCWQAMKRRCANPNCKDWKDYGGKGISALIPNPTRRQSKRYEPTHSKTDSQIREVPQPAISPDEAELEPRAKVGAAHATHHHGEASVCKRWRCSFSAFLNDMGPMPEGYQIDRIDNSKGYEPRNCRWATGRMNCNNKGNNRRLTFCGQTKTVTEWARTIGVPIPTLFSRLYAGCSVDQILNSNRPYRV